LKTTVRLGGVVTAVLALAVETDAPAAVRALAYPIPEVGLVHALNVGAARYARRDPS
jgi:hypothetical protein